MRRPRFVLAFSPLLVLVFVLVSRPAAAQGTRADYERADNLRRLTQGKVFRDRVQPRWIGDAGRFWYHVQTAPNQHEFIVVDPAKGTRAPAFDHAKLAAALARETGKPVSATQVPFETIVVDGDAVQFETGGQWWRYEPGADRLAKSDRPKAENRATTAPAPGPRRPRGPRRPGAHRAATSPDGRWTVVLEGQDLVLKDRNSEGATRRLTTDGKDGDAYEPAVFWAPDSKRFVALKTDQGDTRKVHLVESSPRDQVQPKLHSHDYLKPGDRVRVSRPHLFDPEAGKELPIQGDLTPNPWSLDQFRWADDGKRFRFVYNQRGHQVVRLIAVDGATGAAKAIIDEHQKTFIDYSQKWSLRELDETDEALWTSERDGWNHLYLIDAKTGAVKNQVTKGEWVVRSVDRVDAETRQVWFQAGGIRPGQDPYQVHFARVNFDGAGLVVLTEGDGTHEVEFSPDGAYLVDTYSRVDMPPVCELRRASDGSLVRVLEKADWSALLATGWKAPERFVAKGRDGKTDIHGLIFRPTTFDGSKRYPVIEQIYAGPQGAFVPKRFAAYHGTQGLAELGFVVVQIDGMGTNWRSKAFHDVCWKNLGDAGLPDRVLWMKAAAQADPALDLERVGVYGGSAGGQNALGALLSHPEFYKVGAADCGCHDNRMDKIWWNEAWMGWPIGPHYAEQSNVTNAHKLRGKLLLTVGELDHNVDPASTMQVVNALIKADKDFELIVFPGADHGAGSGRYGDRRRRDFFVRHLLGVEPRTR